MVKTNEEMNPNNQETTPNLLNPNLKKNVFLKFRWKGRIFNAI